MERNACPGLRVEALAVWLLFAGVALAVFITYTRVPSEALYHVSRGGVVGGASRALVYANFPLALVAIALVAVSWSKRMGPRLRTIAIASVALSAVVYWPGVVQQSNLDARPINVLAVSGVVLSLLLSALRARRCGVVTRTGPSRGDALRVTLAILVLALAIPWIAAETGQYLGGVPVLGSIFQSGELRSQPGTPGRHPAVHHGHHHGMDGTLLVLTALLLSRTLPSLESPRIRTWLAPYLALMLSYGIGNIANDFWLEQVVKRGWTDWAIPDVTEPRATTAWAAIVLAAVVIWALWFRPLARDTAS